MTDPFFVSQNCWYFKVSLFMFQIKSYKQWEFTYKDLMKMLQYLPQVKISACTILALGMASCFSGRNSKYIKPKTSAHLNPTM